MAFTEAQQRTWTKLYGMLEPRIEQYACKEYLDGYAGLQMAKDHIPSVDELNAKITPATGWSVVRTTTRYSDAVDWYNHFNQRQFLITDYIREEKELEFTPEPDMFHDVFGHLPFLMDKPYAEFEELFAPTFLRVGDEDREMVKRLAWYSAEFGMVRENGELKVFGAGLLSSAGEMDRVANGEVPIEEFTCESVCEHAKSVWEFNKLLFVADSLASYHEMIEEYFAKMPDRES